MATGEPDVALSFYDIMEKQSFYSFLDPVTGLLTTDKMGSHIVDW